MNKEIRKAIMAGSTLRNKFLRKKLHSAEKRSRDTQRKYCVKLIRKSIIKYFGNLNVKNITENKIFWKTVGQNFPAKNQ